MWKLIFHIPEFYYKCNCNGALIIAIVQQTAKFFVNCTTHQFAGLTTLSSNLESIGSEKCMCVLRPISIHVYQKRFQLITFLRNNIIEMYGQQPFFHAIPT